MKTVFDVWLVMHGNGNATRADGWYLDGCCKAAAAHFALLDRAGGLQPLALNLDLQVEFRSTKAL